MREAGILVVTFVPKTDKPMHCELNPNWVPAADKAQLTDEDRKRQSEEIEAYKRRIRLAAVGGPVRRASE